MPDATTTRKPRSSSPRTKATAPRPAVLRADDEAPPALPDEPNERVVAHVGRGASGKAEAGFSPNDMSVEAVYARQEQRYKESGYLGDRWDPRSKQRAVQVPNGRGGHRLALRPVVSLEEALGDRPTTEDYYHPEHGWMRGVKKETDIEATRTDNVFAGPD